MGLNFSTTGDASMQGRLKVSPRDGDLRTPIGAPPQRRALQRKK